MSLALVYIPLCNGIFSTLLNYLLRKHLYCVCCYICIPTITLLAETLVLIVSPNSTTCNQLFNIIYCVGLLKLTIINMYFSEIIYAVEAC